MVSAFKSLIRFKLIFVSHVCKMGGCESNFTFSCEYCFSTPFILSPLSILGTSVKWYSTIYVKVYFWALYSVPFVYCVCFILDSNCFHCGSFVIYYEIRILMLPILFCVKIIMSVWCLLWFHMNFMIFLSVFVRNLVYSCRVQFH